MSPTDSLGERVGIASRSGGIAERENFIRKQRRAAVGPRTFTTPTRCETHFCDEIARTHPKVRTLSLWHVCARSGLLAACNS